ncbi:MAG: hypothetical protein JW726_12355 [Anaerolineales bacterium]|nr:hypothetical protein [Anaerolineales bacterium]
MLSLLPSHQSLHTLLAQGMGNGLHWFPEDIAVVRLAAVMVGMANGHGGTILLGISPRAGEIVGLQDVEEVTDRVFQSALLANPPLVLPIPCRLQVRSGAGEGLVDILWVTIPAGLPNVYSLDGRYLGREGRQTNPLSARMLRSLLVERGVVQFESRIPPDADLDDLDAAQVRAYLEHLGEAADFSSMGGMPVTTHQFMIRRGCLREVDGVLKPTYAALLLFGRYPQQWLPNATLLAARFPATAMTDAFIKQEISGSLPEQLRQAEAFVRGNLRSVVRLSGLMHEEKPEYPLDAVRELLVNAIAHRDYNVQGDNIHVYIYSDRLEVHSPGGLPGPVNLDNLLEARFSRNAVIMQVLSDMGFVERLGYGLNRVVYVLQQAGLRPPLFEESAGSFRVTLSGAAVDRALGKELPDLSVYEALDLNQRQQAALVYLISNHRITSREYQDQCPDVHAETLRRDLADLVSRGLLIKIGDKRATYYILKKIPAER